MGDGLLGKCKPCTKNDTNTRVKKLSQTNLDWVLAERERSRIKNKKRMLLGLANKCTDRCKKYFKKYPEKYKAQKAASNAIRDGRLLKQPCEVCGDKTVQAHHDDYSKPLAVRWLCVTHHNEFHVDQRTAKLIEKMTMIAARKEGA